MRFAASYFVNLLNRRPGLEIAAFVIVGWVGVKLIVYTLSHPALSVLPEGFAKLPAWKYTFYAVLVLIALCGWFLSKEKKKRQSERAEMRNSVRLTKDGEERCEWSSGLRKRWRHSDISASSC